MKEKFTLKRMIIVVLLVALYSSVFYVISDIAGDSILSEVKSKNYIKVDLTNTLVEAQKSYDSEEDTEAIVSKADIGSYPELNASATSVTTVTTVTTSETTLPTNVTTRPSVTTPDTTTQATTTVTTTEEITTTVPTTTEPPETTTEEEEFEIEDDEDEVVVEDEDEFEFEIEDDDEEEVTIVDDWTTIDEEWLQSVLDEYYANLDSTPPLPDDGTIFLPEASAPGFYPSDNLYTTNSWKNEMFTVYNKRTKSYVTDTAFNIVCRVTFNEMSTSRHEEAIKAQAVAAYTYIKSYLIEGEIPDISLKDEIPDKIRKCVEAVDGLAIYHNNEYIKAYFSASTGGYSASSKNVWGGHRPYLVSVRNDFDYLDTENYGRVTTYTLAEVKNAIESKTDIRLSNNPENWIQVLSQADTIYADKLSIDGHTSAYISGKERVITGYVFRMYILNIRSTSFTVSYDNGVFTFVTYGFGHGVGMSQNGADLYARYGGYTYDQILHHYFTDVVIR